MAADELHRLRATNPIDEQRLGLPELDELQRGWLAREADTAVSPIRRRRFGLWAGGGLSSFAIAGLVAAGAAAATLTAVTGDPLGRVPSVEVAPRAGTERLAIASAADPDGGPRWTVQVGRAPQGLICLNLGQILDGKLGIRGLDGRFRTTAVDRTDECAVPPSADDLLVYGRTLVGLPGRGPISVVYGVAGPRVRSLRVAYNDGMTAKLPLARDRVFVVARRGSLRRTVPTLWSVSTPNTPNERYYVGRATLVGSTDGLGIQRRSQPTRRPLDPTEVPR